MAKNSRRGASRGSNKKQSRPVPGWVWLFTGIAAGLFVAFLVHLARVQMDQGLDSPVVDTTPPTDQGDQDEQADKGDGQPKFDFYAVLPKMEVIVPKDEREESSDAGDDENARRDGDRAGESDTGDDGRAAEGEPVAGRNDKKYLLQAGSFRNQKDADRRRAELILDGYEVRIQPVETDTGDNWHRVMIGPYSNKNALHRAKDKLAANGVETLPIQLKE